MIDLHQADTTADQTAAGGTSTADQDMEKKVCCYHADVSYVDARTGEFELIVVTRGEPGYRVVATYAGLAEAQDRASGLNLQGGIDPATKRDIICSSRAASRSCTKEGDPL
jgi:hypothetical protein